MLNQETSKAVQINPTQFYDLVKVAESFDFNGTKEILKILEDLCNSFDKQVEEIGDTYNAMLSEAQQSFKTKNPFDMKSQTDWFKEFKHTMGGGNFVSMILNIARGIQMGFHELRDIVRDLQPVQLMFFGERRLPQTQEEFRDFTLVMQMNQVPLHRFILALEHASLLQNVVVSIARNVVHHLESYHQMLRHRHTVEGVKIHGDPIRTDLAIAIFENADAHGEIQDGKSPDEISAYTVRKATILADSICGGLFGGFVKDPAEVISFLSTNLKSMWEAADRVEVKTRDAANTVRIVLGAKNRKRMMSYQMFKEALESLNELDPREIRERDKGGMLSAEERSDHDFQNETIRQIAEALTKQEGEEIIRFVLARKAERYKQQRDENSFYVCKVGGGNSFLGEAPGALEVVPGIKPKVDLSDILGTGFGDVRLMIDQAKDSSIWSDLFLATSPSGKIDKMNVLLVGPQGCGKTEALRALGGDTNSIGIFAQASDFLTCWKGEAEKNPKRLFEAGLKLQKETDRQVFFLIDEIDTILNGDRGQAAFGGTNLATEFQVLMDGITAYPGLAVWGATNHPERIPMPLIRRFAKVILVGELNNEDRVGLLRRFLSYLPLSPNFNDQIWNDGGKLLSGAVGDTVRKVTDDIWRKKMRTFVSKTPDEAKKVVAFLQEGGVRFDRSNFTRERRFLFQNMLREQQVEVTPEDLLSSIHYYLENAAIRAEIETARATYEIAREYLVGMISPTAMAAE